MRGGRLRGRQIVVLIVALGILIEIPLLGYVLTRNDGNATVVAPSDSTSGGSLRGLTLHPVAGTFKPDNTTLTGCADQRCYEQAYGNIAYRQGPKAAFTLVQKQFGAGADPSCHRIVHAIGAASLARNEGNVAKTFAEGAATCWSGYYHGVLERAFVKVRSFTADALGDKARSLCTDPGVRASRWLTFQCLHGLGHGLMITTAYQLPLSLKVCKRLQTHWDRSSCKGGVFMENVLTSYGGQSPWVRDDDLLYPCTVVAEEDKYNCYQQAGTRILRVIGEDWEATAELCAEAEADYTGICFRSYGQNASVRASRSPRPTVATCAIAKPYGGEPDCIRAAASDIAGAVGARGGARLCEIASVEVRGTCYHAIGRMIGNLHLTRPAREAACRAITGSARFLAECVRGSRRTVAAPEIVR